MNNGNVNRKNSLPNTENKSQYLLFECYNLGEKGINKMGSIYLDDKAMPTHRVSFFHDKAGLMNGGR